MRRMYSKQELSRIIKVVFEEELADGALDESIADAVDAYLVEHPVDITALEGQDVSLATLTSTGDVDVGGDLDVTGSISGAEIVEKMNGYSASMITTTGWTITPVYLSAVKTGNKITIVVAVKATKTDAEAVGYPYLAYVTIPASVHNKLYPFSSSMLDYKEGIAFASTNVSVRQYCEKASSNRLAFGIAGTNNFVLNTEYYIRHEVTFLLSDSFIS